jgi:hypothetical protein
VITDGKNMNSKVLLVFLKQTFTAGSYIEIIEKRVAVEVVHCAIAEFLVPDWGI